MAFNIVIILTLIVNGTRFYIKDVVKQNGYETHLFYGHLGDIQNLRALIKKEKDVNKKNRLSSLLDFFYASLFITIISFFVVIATQ
jgi:hypothetical protein